MRTHKLGLVLVAFVFALAFTGCGPSKDELAARERARLEAEKQATADAAKANKAITDMNKKMFGRTNNSTSGAPTPTTTSGQPAPDPKTP